MNIEWNKVTWYSKLLAVILFVIIFCAGFYFGVELRKAQRQQEQIAEEPIVGLKDDTYCFNRHQAKTASAPYEVTENIMLNIRGNEVSGVKTGTQQGPDMSNGYQGTLKGTMEGNNIEVVFAYTVEGSSNKEFEIYTVDGKDLIKKRYPLVDDGNMLTPDETKEATLQKYTGVECINESQL